VGIKNSILIVGNDIIWRER